MGDDAIRPAPRKSGCFKWALGCLVCVVLVAGISALTLWYFLSRWDAGQSAWEHLPPEVSWAAEVYDVKGILGGAVRDEGIQALLRNINEELRPLLRELDAGTDPDGIRSLVDAYATLSPFYTTVLPNAGIIGAIGSNSGEAFAILQPPRWFSWFVSGENGVVQTIDAQDGDVVYLTTMDGWALIALDRDTIDLLIEAWPKKAAPLGAGMASQQPYILIADADQRIVQKRVLSRKKQGTQAEAPLPTTPSGPGHFMLRDPLAEAPLAVEAEEEDSYLRMALTSEADGWLFRLEMVGSAHFASASSLIESIDAELGADRPAVALPDASDMELTARLPQDLFENFLENLQDDVEPVGDNAPPYRRLGWRWFNDAWMRRAGGDFAILASRPAARTEESYPPMPVFSLGWTLADPSQATDAAKSFSVALTEWIDAMKASGMPTWLQSAGDSSVGYTVAPAGDAGVVELPPVLVNAAQPAWRFNKTMGWLGTDPAGLPDLTVQERIHLDAVKAPAPGEFNAAGSWDLSRDFVDALHAFIADRLESLPDKYFTAISREEMRKNMQRARSILVAFPKAASRIKFDLNKDSVYLKTYIPHGKAAEQNK